MMRRVCTGWLMVLMMTSLGCGGKEEAGPETYAVVGVVEGRQGTQGLVVAHEPIPDVMEAMTMPFIARDSAEVATVQVGDSIRFTWVRGPQFTWIEDVEVFARPDSVRPATSPPDTLATDTLASTP